MKVQLCAAIFLALAIAVPAQAEDKCPPLKMIASVDLLPASNDRDHNVEVLIAGQKRKMTIDLGAEVSMLSQKAADEFKLETHESNIIVYSVTGSSTSRYTSADLQLDRLKGNVKLMVAPDLDGFSDDPSVVGLLGADILANFDLSFDYGTKKLDLLDHDHCAGNILYWPAQAVATVPFKIWHQTKIVFDVVLDGKTMKAVLDTGATNSTIRLNTAVKEFGLQPGSADTPQYGHLNEREDLLTYHHTFKSLDFHGIAVSNPILTLIPEKLSKKLDPGAPLGSHIPATDDAVQAPILIGMNVLKHLHIYIAYREKKIYITPAGTPKPASAAQ